MNVNGYGYHILLGIIQGLTEFLPISSSGHLVIAQNLLGMQKPQISLDIILHLGTMFAVIIYFRKDIIAMVKSLCHPGSKYFRLALLLAIGTIPVAILGFLFKRYFKLLFTSPVYSSFFLIITGGILFLTKFCRPPPGHDAKDIRAFSFKDALIIGISQTMALAPGISRSGITIATGLFRNINRTLCARYSLLLSIPAILGAVAAEGRQCTALSPSDLWTVLLGFAASLIAGWLAIAILVRCLQQARFYIFSYYCWALGIFSLYISPFTKNMLY